jgi:hypothetical protein
MMKNIPRVGEMRKVVKRVMYWGLAMGAVAVGWAGCATVGPDDPTYVPPDRPATPTAPTAAPSSANTTAAPAASSNTTTGSNTTTDDKQPIGIQVGGGGPISIGM